MRVRVRVRGNENLSERNTNMGTGDRLKFVFTWEEFVIVCEQFESSSCGDWVHIETVREQVMNGSHEKSGKGGSEFEFEFSEAP